ncbi:MAG: glycosyltransferase family 4 protein [Candidatus Latescibacterota bacterium]|nr:glycosyltransferase family 4 protein [Candidatus Latescibacterota bacterium]
MRVALLGNLCNTAYTFGKVLRKEGINVEVFITEKERTQAAAYPEWEDPEIDSKNINWIHYYNQRNPLSLVQTMFQLRNFDIIHAFGLPNTYCQFLGRPLISHALGADLKEVVYEPTLIGLLLKKAFRQTKNLLFSDIDHVPHIHRLELEQSQYFPAAVDVEKYSPASKGSYISDNKIVLFHSAFLDWTKRQPTSKRNDLFFRAFSRFADQRDDLILRVIAAGPDTESTKKLVYELGLSKIVEFLPPLNKQELLEHYRSCDLIVDQFGMPKFGVNALEGMACGRPVLLYLDKDLAKQCYATLPPVGIANGEQEIYKTLHDICDKEKLHSIGLKCRDWILSNHNGKVVAKKLIQLYTQIKQHSESDSL